MVVEIGHRPLHLVIFIFAMNLPFISINVIGNGQMWRLSRNKLTLTYY